jgi:hypothetical protein
MYIPTVSMGMPVQVLYRSLLPIGGEGHHVVVSQNAGNEWYDLLHMLFLLNAYSFVQLVAHKTGVECFLMNAAAWKLKEVF